MIKKTKKDFIKKIITSHPDINFKIKTNDTKRAIAWKIFDAGLINDFVDWQGFAKHKIDEFCRQKYDDLFYRIK